MADFRYIPEWSSLEAELLDILAHDHDAQTKPKVDALIAKLQQRDQELEDYLARLRPAVPASGGYASLTGPGKTNAGPLNSYLTQLGGLVVNDSDPGGVGIYLHETSNNGIVIRNVGSGGLDLEDTGAGGLDLNEHGNGGINIADHGTGGLNLASTEGITFQGGSVGPVTPFGLFTADTLAHLPTPPAGFVPAWGYTREPHIYYYPSPAGPWQQIDTPSGPSGIAVETVGALAIPSAGLASGTNVAFNDVLNLQGTDLSWVIGTPDVVTVVTAGYYEINFFLQWAPSAVGGRLLSPNITTSDPLSSNWFPFLTQPTVASAGVETGQSLTSPTLHLAAGDKIGVQAGQDSGANLNVYATLFVKKIA